MPTTTDRYDIRLPGDLADTASQAIDYAILEARERARLHCIPCEWSGKLISGTIGESWEITVRVYRRRNRK